MKKIKKLLKKSSLINKMYRKLVYLNRSIKSGKYNKNPQLLGKISPNDGMFYMDENVEHYISVGVSAIQNIEEALKLGNKQFEDLNSVLDIPCGHGRVLRHLVKKISPGKITACEIIEDAVDFCVKEFGCKGFISSNDFNKLTFPEKYDLIWVGSLFTHLREDYFIKLFEVLINYLNKDGIMVFTAHGSYSLERLDSYLLSYDSIEAVKESLEKGNGFCFFPEKENPHYGVSISLNEYIEKLIKIKFKDRIKLLLYKHRGWDNHQDVYAIQRI